MTGHYNILSINNIS